MNEVTIMCIVLVIVVLCGILMLSTPTKYENPNLNSYPDSITTTTEPFIPKIGESRYTNQTVFPSVTNWPAPPGFDLDPTYPSTDQTNIIYHNDSKWPAPLGFDLDPTYPPYDPSMSTIYKGESTWPAPLGFDLDPTYPS